MPFKNFCSSVSSYYLVLATIVVTTAVAKSNQTKQIDRHYAHSAYLNDNESVLFKWHIAATQAGEQRVMMYLDAEISAPTLGYVGWGISTNGGMIGADILLMWVDDATGTAHIQDRYADAFAEPKLDDDQSSILDFEGHQNATHTTFRFRRELDAGCTDPKNDLSVPPSATHIIYALGERDVDLSSTAHAGGHAEYHGRQNRGSKTLYIREDSNGQFESDRAAAQAETTEIFEIRSADIMVPVQETFYQCSMQPLPQITDELHVVGFEPSVENNRTNLVHHFITYLCNRGFVPKEKQFNCYNAQTDSGEARSVKEIEQCIGNVIWSWGVGGASLYMPKGIGLAFNAKDSGRYILVETHYDSSILKKPQKSGRSGVKLLITHKLRPNNAKHLFLTGLAPGSAPLIPGLTSSFQAVSTCSGQCTDKFLPPSGITVFSVFLHAHKHTRAMVLRQFRNGTELPIISSDVNYDFNYQIWRRTNVTILPGDDVTLECNFTTTQSNKTVFGGWGSHEEMCIAFVYVTPPPELSICATVHSSELSMTAVMHRRPPAKIPVARWVMDYYKRMEREHNKKGAPRVEQEFQVAEPETNTAVASTGLAAHDDLQVQLFKALFKRNDSLLLEVDLEHQLPMDKKLIAKDALKGAVLIQSLIGLRSKMRRMDWVEQHDAIERLQRVYLTGPNMNFCLTDTDYTYAVQVPYESYKSASRPLRVDELVDQC